MAGGKETPRQKMIGMMYLVLTALLALNVSKQIISAFITLNDKLETSAHVIDIKAQDSYGRIDQKKAAIIALDGDLTDFNIWEEKSIQLKLKTKELTSFLLSECNDMIVSAEGEDWVQDRDEDRNILSLKPLDQIQAIDNYDVPTHMFVGGNPEAPNERGQDLVNRIHDYRNFVSELLGTYRKGSANYMFTAPKSIANLKDALIGVNKEDSTVIKQFFTTLTIPEKLHMHGEDNMLPWASVTFDHAPIVAAAAMFTSLRLDIKNAEAMAAKYIVDKIDAPIFEFNKIEPMAIASSAYLNAGDSVPLRVMIAAYDSNEVSMIRYGLDSDTLPERWTETAGGLNLSSSLPGQHKLKGAIGVRERGETKWKPWEFSYTVGQPIGVVAQPEMRVLYIGYDNVVEATASGFPAENVTMSGQNCSIVRQGNKYIAQVLRGTRNASISVVGKTADGKNTNVGTYEYKCVPLPDPKITLGGIKNGDEVSLRKAKDMTTVLAKYSSDITLDADFSVISGEVRVGSVPGKGKVLSNGKLDADAKRKIAQGKGSLVQILVEYRKPDGTTKRDGLSFYIKP
jgi:gliding motility-associated protein GldM